MTIEPTSCPAKTTVPSLIQHLSQQFGSLPQLYDNDGYITFSEVDHQSKELARGLLAADVGKGTRVGILLPNGREYLISLMAILRIGGTAVLLSTLFKDRELAHAIRHADLHTLIGADSYLNNNYVDYLEAALPSIKSCNSTRPLRIMEAPFLRSIWLDGNQQASWVNGNIQGLVKLANQKKFSHLLVEAVEAEVVPADDAIIIYTSGTSAEPKAVIHSQGNLVRQSWNMSRLLNCNAGDRLLTTQPFFWVGGLVTSLLSASCAGVATVCPKGQTPDDIAECIQKWNTSSIMLWAHQISSLLEGHHFEALIKNMKPAYAPLLGLFGLSTAETTPNSLGMTETLGPHSMDPAIPLTADCSGSYGRAVGSIERKIINPETGESLSPGTQGVLCLRGGALMTGLHRKERAEVFDEDGFYHTDDLCSIRSNDHLFFKGRRNTMLKISGANVSPLEVEEALLDLPDVKHAVILGFHQPEIGDMLVAAVVPKKESELSEPKLRLELKKHLSSFKVPRHFFIFNEEELPWTASAKINRAALRKQLEIYLAKSE